jgi:hypothetical protein
MNLFDLLERIFRGIVYFLYNFVETTLIILRHPLKGPIRLHQVHRRRGTSQLGGLSYLFVIFLPLFWILLSVSSGDLSSEGELPIASRINQWAAHMPSFQWDGLWPVLLASFTTTIIIDATLRLIVRWWLPGQPSRRQTILAGTEYSLLWVILTFVLLIFKNDRLDLEVGGVFEVLIPLVAVLTPFLPAATIFGRALPPKARGRRWATLLQQVFCFAVITAVTVMAMIAGAKVGDSVQQQRNFEEYQRSAEALTMKTLRCIRSNDDRVDVFALLDLQGDRARALSESDMLLALQQKNDELLVVEVEWTDTSSKDFVVVDETSPQIVHLRTKEAVSVSQVINCRLRPHDSEFQVDNSFWTRITN